MSLSSGDQDNGELSGDGICLYDTGDFSLFEGNAIWSEGRVKWCGHARRQELELWLVRAQTAFPLRVERVWAPAPSRDP